MVQDFTKQITGQRMKLSKRLSRRCRQKREQRRKKYFFSKRYLSEEEFEKYQKPGAIIPMYRLKELFG